MRIVPLLLAALLLTACTQDATEDPSQQPPVNSSAPVTPAAAPTSATPAEPSALQGVRLTGDGIDTSEQVTTFGDDFEQVQPALLATLGEPTTDTGVVSSTGAYGVCPGSRLRVLEFEGGALRVLFGDVIGPGLTMYQWALTEPTGPGVQASALVGDVTTFEFGVGDTLGALRAGVQGRAELDVRPGDEMLEPSFTLVDQSSGFFGLLTGTTDADTVAQVQAGEACGE